MSSERDYTLIIDRSGSMALKDQPGGRSRWAVARESTQALAAKCDELDPDGITLYLFAARFKRYDNVTAERVAQVFLENEPCGGTDLAGVLAHAFESYFERKRAGHAKRTGETIVVVTDGEPDDPKAVMRTIVEASRRIDRDEELGVSLVQIGSDPQARRFLKVLDDDLGRAGAPFDICDTVTLDEMEDIGLAEVLLRAVND
jgi:Mg-chelatase subunit ChlD